MTRHRLLLSGVVAGLFAAAGCLQPANHKSATGLPPDLRAAPAQPDAQPAAPAADQSAEPSPRKPDTMDASAGTVDALARKVEQYSREISPQVSQKGTAGAKPSAVEWIDPSELRLATIDESDDRAPASSAQPVRPVIETSPMQANQVASAATVTPGAELVANLPASQEPATLPAAATSVKLHRGQGDQLVEKLSKRVRENPREVSAHLEYQLLVFLMDQQVPELSTLASLPSEDRELLAAVLDGIVLFRNTLRSDNNMLLSRKIRPLVDMADRIKSQADLTIPTIVLCNSVNGFGKYEPIEPARFAAGTEHKAVIYCEIANFASNLNEQRLWETRLRQEMTLYTEGGVAVWSDRTEQIADTARARRNDFFINKRIVIPSNLTIGRYLLKVSIVDLQANRVAEASVPIAIVAK